jgi:predicted component of type VI protein secretion system
MPHVWNMGAPNLLSADHAYRLHRKSRFCSARLGERLERATVAGAEKRDYDGNGVENHAMNATLLVVAGNTTKRKVRLKLPCVLGRSREADVTVPHPLISRRHCKLSEADGLLMLRDLGSVNGTIIGGRRISSAPLLPDGEFTIGPLTFRVLYDYDGDFESLPATNYVDEVADAEEVEFAEAAEEYLDPIEPLSADMPASLSDSDVVEVPDFIALADADPDVEVPPILVEPEIADSKPEVLAAPAWPMATPDKMPTEFLLPSPGEPTESPWATDVPDVEAAKRADAKQKPAASRAQPAQSPPPVIKQPNYGDDADPEFGSFLEDLR